jgi:membrane protein YdbS with pleckstrin-like domain
VADERPEPNRRLAPAARVIWTLELLGGGVVALVVAVIAGRILRHHTDDDALHTLGSALPWVALIGGILAAAIVPTLRMRRWRWRLDDDELDLRHGVVTEIRTIVPVARIQHVDVRRTFWGQLFSVADVVVHTAAGTTEIPALEEVVAAVIRDRLAGLIRTPDDE